MVRAGHDSEGQNRQGMAGLVHELHDRTSEGRAGKGMAGLGHSTTGPGMGRQVRAGHGRAGLGTAGQGRAGRARHG